MIVFSNGGGVTKGTDDAGDSQPIGVVSADQNELRIADMEQRDWLQDIIKELKIMNIHLQTITDMSIERTEVEV